MTAISLPEKKNPSQVAQEETPWPIKRLLIRQIQPARGSAAGDDKRAGEQRLAAQVHFDGLRAKPFSFLAEIDADHVPGLELGAEARPLLAHVVDEFRPLDAVGEAGEVLDQGGDGQLAAGLVPLDDEWRQIGAGGVDGGSQPRASGADDDDVANVVGHRSRNRFRAAQKDAGATELDGSKNSALRILTSAGRLR